MLVRVPLHVAQELQAAAERERHSVSEHAAMLLSRALSGGDAA